MMFDSDKISTIVDEIRVAIFNGSIKADAYLKPNVEKREGNVVAVVIAPFLIGKPPPPGVKMQDKIEELYQEIERAILEKAKDYGVELQVVRER
jgi:hypothetical protein